MSVNDQQFSSSVAERLERWVVENLESGSYLPAEKVLAETYGVSRLTIREAMRHLAGRGLIDTSQGRRAQVTRIQSTPLVSFLTYAAMREPTSVLDLIEVRVALEVQSASLAATRANRAGIAAIESALAAMRAAADVADASQDDSDNAEIVARYNEADVRFHEALALASGNRILSALLESIEVPLRQSFDLSINNQIVDGHVSLNENVHAHAEILEFVRQGEARKASTAMRSHLKKSERDLRAVLLSRMQLVPPGSANRKGSARTP